MAESIVFQDKQKPKRRGLKWPLIIGAIVVALSAGGLARWVQMKAADNHKAAVAKSVDDSRKLLGEGRTAAASKIVEEKLADPSTPKSEKYDLYLTQGEIAVTQKDYQAAITSFQNASKLDDTYEAESRLGALYEQQGDRQNAITHYKKAIELNTSGPTHEAENNNLNELIKLLESGQ